MYLFGTDLLRSTDVTEDDIVLKREVVPRSDRSRLQRFNELEDILCRMLDDGAMLLCDGCVSRGGGAGGRRPNLYIIVLVVKAVTETQLSCLLLLEGDPSLPPPTPHLFAFIHVSFPEYLKVSSFLLRIIGSSTQH